MSAKTLVVGVGNLLLGDEGLGVHVARELERRRAELPEGVEILDAGTSLLDQLARLADCREAILVDAVELGGAPGTLYRIDDLLRGLPEGPEPPSVSLHDLDLIAALRIGRVLGLLPERVSLIGAEPRSVAPGTGLSPALAVARDRIVELLVLELAARPARLAARAAAGAPPASSRL